MKTDTLKDTATGANVAALPERVCLRCDERTGARYVTVITSPAGYAAERSIVMRDALLGGETPHLCSDCAVVLTIYGRVLGWQLQPAGGVLSRSGAGTPTRTARRAA
jgi:hypothetical protein